MNQILGVVHDDDRVRVSTFVPAHSCVHGVEVLRLRGRPGLRIGDRMDPPILPREGLHASHRLRIVWIDAYEDVIVRILDSLTGPSQHPVDHAILVPACDVDRDALLRLREELRLAQRRIIDTFEAAMYPVDPVQRIENDRIDAEQEVYGGKDDGQLGDQASCLTRDLKDGQGDVPL